MQLTDAQWRAAGVRQEILLRVLPVQRHDIMGPLSVLRMSLAVAKRRAQAETPDIALLRDKLGDLHGQIDDLLAAIASLRCWDGARHEPVDAAIAARTCIELARSALAMQGHRVEQHPGNAVPAEIVTSTGNDTGNADADADDSVAMPDICYASLGLLLHAADSVNVPHTFHLRQRPGQLGLSLAARPALAGQAPRAALPAPHRPALTAEVLGWLIDDLGWQLQQPTATDWILRWPAGAGRRSAQYLSTLKEP